MCVFGEYAQQRRGPVDSELGVAKADSVCMGEMEKDNLVPRHGKCTVFFDTGVQAEIRRPVCMIVC